MLMDAVSTSLKETCWEIALRYEIRFIEIVTNEDYVHFLLQSVLSILPSAMVESIKSIIGKAIFRIHPDIKKFLWGGSLWTSGYYINTVGQYGNETVLRNYAKNQ